MSELAPRGIYASGKSSSAAGLCGSGETKIELKGKLVNIGEFVESRIGTPTEVEKGVFRQEVGVNGLKTVSADGQPVTRPVSAVFRIDTPSFLVELKEESGRSITLTPETQVMSRIGEDSAWIRSSDVMADEEVMMVGPSGDHSQPDWSRITSSERKVDGIPEHVYDITVEDAHSFIGNGFVVHNTAAAVKDEFGDGRWTLEAGALVLADKGLACIDELDKMTEQDRSSMHEAMESQRISVAKAGITATLQCRCSMLGAANPKYGRFDDNESLSDQINMPPALLSRFDLIFALTDRPKAELDTRIAEHIIMGHVRGEVRRHTDMSVLDDLGVDYKKIMEDTDKLKPVYDREFLRKYVAHAKRYVPVMSKEARKIIQEKYLAIRELGEVQGASVPITARQLEAFIRLSEASARIRLSNVVTKEDAERAVRIVEFYLNKMAKDSGSMDVDKVMTGFSKTDRNKIAVVRTLIHSNSEPGKGVSFKTLLEHAPDKNLTEQELRDALKKLRNAGDIYEPSHDFYKLSSGD